MSIAFFDIDGTILPVPSLEHRLLRELRWRGKIPLRNYFAWGAEYLRFAWRDSVSATHANKLYWRGLSPDFFSHSIANHRSDWLPRLFPAAVQRVWWHAMRGDSVVLVSGTIAPLAEIVKFALERELLFRGVDTEVSVLATTLECSGEKLTGRVTGAAMVGHQKLLASKSFADVRSIPLSACFAYGDSSLDRWMLAAVGQPFAVNPTVRLKQLARLRGWRVLAWSHAPSHSSLQIEPGSPPQNGLKWTSLKRKGQVPS